MRACACVHEGLCGHDSSPRSVRQNIQVQGRAAEQNAACQTCICTGHTHSHTLREKLCAQIFTRQQYIRKLKAYVKKICSPKIFMFAYFAGGYQQDDLQPSL